MYEIYEQTGDYFPEYINFGQDVIFYIHWWDQKDKNKIIRKGCIKEASIFDFNLEERELAIFISFIESFLKNQFYGREFTIGNLKAKVIFTKDKEPLLNIKLLDILYDDNGKITKQEIKHQKSFSKVGANFILKCYQIATREYNLCFASSSPTRITID